MSLENKIAKVTNDNYADATLKGKAVQAGDAVADFVNSAFDRTEDVVKTKATEFYKSRAFEPEYAAARKDSSDIANLGSERVTSLVTAFENTDTMVCNHSYPKQVQILTGYKKLLEGQINVIDSRIDFVKRVR